MNTPRHADRIDHHHREIERTYQDFDAMGIRVFSARTPAHRAEKAVA